jgi:hypothetical protein
MKRKERQEPWNPCHRCCSRQPGEGCHNRIFNELKSKIKFCNLVTCENYVEDEEYEIYLEEYYLWRVANDTDYERSDEEICGKKDRVWEKICQIQETENNYSGEYMHNYVWIKLFRAKNTELTEDLLNYENIKNGEIIIKNKKRNLIIYHLDIY